MFRVGIRTAGVITLEIMATVGLFLLRNGTTALSTAGWDFLSVQAWQPDSGNFGIAAVLVGTLLIASVALCVAFPLALGVALYISEYARPSLRRGLVSLVDLMAAVPSVVYGLFGAIGTLGVGERITVATGQGEHVYRVTGVRRTGAPQAAALTKDEGRLTLVTADGPAFLPSEVLRVDARLESSPVAANPVLPAMVVRDAEQTMAMDGAEVVPLAR